MVGASAEKPGCYAIHDKAASCDQNRLVKMNCHRRKKTHCGFVTDDEGDDRKHDRARISGKIAELAGTEDEAGVVGVPPRIGISQSGDQKRQGVRCHVKAVGNDGERPKQRAAEDFGDHHDQGKRNRRPRPAFVRRVALAEKDVAMRRPWKSSIAIMHYRSPLPYAVCNQPLPARANRIFTPSQATAPPLLPIASEEPDIRVSKHRLESLAKLPRQQLEGGNRLCCKSHREEFGRLPLLLT